MDRAQDEPLDGNAQPFLQLPERGGFGPAETGGCDIGITECHHGDTARSAGAQQSDGGGRRLLQVVDEDRAHAVQRTAVADDRDRIGDQFGRVDEGASVAVDHELVLGDEPRGRPPLVALGEGTQLREPGGRHTALGAPRHEFAQLGAEPAQPAHVVAELLRPCRPGAVFLVPGEQFGDDLVLLAAREQPRRLLPTGPGALADELEGQRRRRAGERPVGRNADAQCEPVAQPGRRRPGSAQREDFGRAVTAGQDALRERLDERRGLACSRRAEHGGGACVGEGEHRPLGFVERDPVALASEAPGLRRVAAGPETSDRHAVHGSGVRRQRT